MKKFLPILSIPLLLLQTSQAENSLPATFLTTGEKTAEAAPFEKLKADMKAKGYSPVKLTVMGNHLFLDASISGKKGKFLLDTGAMYSSLNEAAVKKFSVVVDTKTKPPEALGVGGKAQIKAIANTKELAFGESKGISQRFYVINSSKRPKAEADLIDGILGTDFLKGQKAIVDYPHNILWVRKASATTESLPKVEPEGYAGVKFVEEHNHLFIDAAINGKKVRFLLDSGAAVCIFKKSAVPQYDFTVIKGRAVINGIGGPVEIKALAKTKQLKIGNLEAVAIDFYVMDFSAWPKQISDRLHGILGSNFLKSRKVMIDYGNHTLWLSK